MVNYYKKIEEEMSKNTSDDLFYRYFLKLFIYNIIKEKMDEMTELHKTSDLELYPNLDTDNINISRRYTIIRDSGNNGAWNYDEQTLCVDSKLYEYYCRKVVEFLDDYHLLAEDADLIDFENSNRIIVTVTSSLYGLIDAYNEEMEYYDEKPILDIYKASDIAEQIRSEKYIKDYVEPYSGFSDATGEEMLAKIQELYNSEDRYDIKDYVEPFYECFILGVLPNLIEEGIRGITFDASFHENKLIDFDFLISPCLGEDSERDYLYWCNRVSLKTTYLAIFSELIKSFLRDYGINFEISTNSVGNRYLIRTSLKNLVDAYYTELQGLELLKPVVAEDPEEVKPAEPEKLAPKVLTKRRLKDLFKRSK